MIIAALIIMTFLYLVTLLQAKSLHKFLTKQDALFDSYEELFFLYQESDKQSKEQIRLYEELIKLYEERLLLADKNKELLQHIPPVTCGEKQH